MNGKDVVKLAADLAAGAITTNEIQRRFGNGVLSSVLAVGAGVGVGLVTNAALDVLDDHTGVVSDLGGVIDDVLELF